MHPFKASQHSSRPVKEDSRADTRSTHLFLETFCTSHDLSFTKCLTPHTETLNGEGRFKRFEQFRLAEERILSTEGYPERNKARKGEYIDGTLKAGSKEGARGEWRRSRPLYHLVPIGTIDSVCSRYSFDSTPPFLLDRTSYPDSTGLFRCWPNLLSALLASEPWTISRDLTG